jgi:hypothetical protein
MAAVSRIRKVQTQREHDNLVDDYVTQGFATIEQGESSTMMRQKSWGSFIGHTIVAVLTIWWTLGLGNLTYALIAHYAAEKILVKIDRPAERPVENKQFEGPKDLEAV